MSSATLDRRRRETDPEDQAGKDVKPPNKLKVLLFRVLPFVFPVVCLFQFGILFSAYRAYRNYVPPPTQIIQVRPYVAPLLDVRESSLERADEWIRERTYDRALQVYTNLGLGKQERLPPAVLYRAALCGEAIGRWDEAREGFRQLATNPKHMLAAAAQLGQARVWIRQGQPSEAKKLLADLILRAHEYGIQSEAIHEDAHHLLALAMSLEAVPPESAASTIVSGVVSRIATDWPIDRPLKWVPLKDAPVENNNPAEPEKIEKLQLRGGALGASRVTGQLQEMPILELLNELATQRKWTLLATDAVKTDLANRSVDIAVQRLPAMTFLICLAEQFDLAWDLNKDNEFTLRMTSELNAEERKSRKISVAINALEGAMLEYPDNPFSPSTRVELANQALLAGRLDEAVTRYKTLIDRSSSNATVMAAYNSGLAYRRIGAYDKARESFFRVADGSPNHPLVEYAHFAIARMYLDHGQAEQSLPHYARAMAASTSDIRRAEVLVNMALAEIVMGRYHRAGELLFLNRGVINNSNSKNVAAFLVSYARYRTLPIKAEVRREAMYMMRSLMALGTDARRLGRAGVLIVGRAYQELALGEIMFDLYTEALAEPASGQVTAEMEFFGASYLYERNSIEPAVLRFKELANNPKNGIWAIRAKTKLAEHALQERQFNECIVACRDLLTPPKDVDVPEVLRLMGQAYEQLGRFKEASFCYAGQLPHTVTEPPQEPPLQ